MTTWGPRLAAVGGIWGLVVGSMVLLGMGPRPVLLALIAAGVAAIVFCAIDIVASCEPIRWLRPLPTTPRPLEDPRANQLLRTIEAAGDDPNRRAALRATLAALGGEPTATSTAATSSENTGNTENDDQRPLPLAEIDRIVRSIEVHGHVS